MNNNNDNLQLLGLCVGGTILLTVVCPLVIIPIGLVVLWALIKYYA